MLEDEGLRPLSFPSSTFLIINLPKLSAKIVNKIGEMGSHYLRPLVFLKKLEGDPLIIIAEVEVLVN